jgi:flagellar protein FliT
MSQRLTTYQQMSALSTQMVAAAQAAEWETLAGLENQLSRLREQLMRLDTAQSDHPDGPDSPANPAPGELDLIRTLIRAILADHETVRAHVRPQLDELHAALGDAVTRRRIDAAYGDSGL